MWTEHKISHLELCILIVTSWLQMVINPNQKEWVIGWRNGEREEGVRERNGERTESEWEERDYECATPVAHLKNFWWEPEGENLKESQWTEEWESERVRENLRVRERERGKVALVTKWVTNKPLVADSSCTLEEEIVIEDVDYFLN